MNRFFAMLTGKRYAPPPTHLNEDESSEDKLYRATKCGHQTKLKGPITAMDHTTPLSMPLNGSGSTDWCLDCCGAMTVPCAKCGEYIMIGDPAWSTTMAIFIDPDWDPVEGAVKVTRGTDEQELVLCGRYSCVHEDLPLIGGMWVPDKDGKGAIRKCDGTLITRV